MSGLARARIAPLLRGGDRCAMAVAVAGALLFAGTLADDALHPPPNGCGTIVAGALIMELTLLAAIGASLALLRVTATYFDWRPSALAYAGLGIVALIPLTALDTLIVAGWAARWIADILAPPL